MKHKTSSNIILVISFSFMGILLWTHACHRQISSNNEVKRIFDTYYANSEYYLSGQIECKNLIYDCGTIYRDIYILEINVDTFDIRKNDIRERLPFFGVYDSISNKVYIQSPIYNYNTDKEYKDGDVLPFIRIDSQDKSVHFSDGLELGMIIVEQSDALSAKENNHTIRF